MFDDFGGNREAVQRVSGWLENGRLPHALLVTAPSGCGRNYFANLVAAQYLGDEAQRVARGVHPDCIDVRGEGASGNIPVKSIREMSYELHKSSVTTEGRRAAILRDVFHLNKNSANALLKILEEPPDDTLFILTASSSADVLDTVRSRCVEITLLPLDLQTCRQAVLQRFPALDAERAQKLCELYGGRLGLVAKALATPERLALADAAERFCDAALVPDKLAVLVALEAASGREQLKDLLNDAALILRQRLNTDYTKAPKIQRAADAVAQALASTARYTAPRLIAAHIAAQL